jgi:hypothetical protein
MKLLLFFHWTWVLHQLSDTLHISLPARQITLNWVSLSGVTTLLLAAAAAPGTAYND